MPVTDARNAAQISIIKENGHPLFEGARLAVCALRALFPQISS